jgi:hypothetical protein
MPTSAISNGSEPTDYKDALKTTKESFRRGRVKQRKQTWALSNPSTVCPERWERPSASSCDFGGLTEKSSIVRFIEDV